MNDRYDNLNILLVEHDHYLIDEGGMDHFYREELIYDFGQYIDSYDIWADLKSIFEININTDQHRLDEWLKDVVDNKVIYHPLYLTEDDFMLTDPRFLEKWPYHYKNHPFNRPNRYQLLAGVTQDQIEGYKLTIFGEEGYGDRKVEWRPINIKGDSGKWPLIT